MDSNQEGFHKNLKGYFRNSMRNFQKTVYSKLRDSNTMKSNINSPHFRYVVISDVHKFLFKETFVKLFEKKGIHPLQNTVHRFELETLEYVSSIFGSKNILKIHSAGDLSFITPWKKVTADLAGIPFSTNNAIVIPLKETDNGKFKCFFPCIGFDTETDELPVWASEFKLSQIIEGFRVMDFPILKKRKRGDGKISVETGENWVSIKRDQVNIDDWIVCRGDWVSVKTEADDAFSALNADGVAARNILMLNNNFTSNHKRQPFDIVKEPTVFGTVIEINTTDLTEHHHVIIDLPRINENQFGNMQIGFKNSCFNSCGFLTHDNFILGE